jgi:hypothetical protein
MAKTPEVKFALQFPQGMVFFLKDTSSPDKAGAAYFKPNNSTEAFMVWGERKELFGKNAINVAKDYKADTGGYSVVYEFSGSDVLTDARLVKGDETVRGQLADGPAVQVLNDSLTEGWLKLYGRQDMEPVTVYNAARFLDGRVLIQLCDRNELYLGTPGNYQKLDARLMAQGGCSMYYEMVSGEKIDLPYSFSGPKRGEMPTFNGEEMMYMNVESGADPAQLGLVIPQKTAIDPFSVPVQKPNPPRNQPKRPGL